MTKRITPDVLLQHLQDECYAGRMTIVQSLWFEDAAQVWAAEQREREILRQNWQRCVDHAARVEEERDELRRELHRIADFVEPHWKGAGETLTSGWLYEEIVHKLKKYSFEVDDAEDKVEELRRENQILKEDCERLRQYGNRDCIAMAEADDDEATLTPEQQKTLYRENMRLSGKWPSAPIKDKPWYSVYQPEPTWLPAPDTKPADMADAQMVEFAFKCSITDRLKEGAGLKERADRVPWHVVGVYRPLYSDSGLPLCSPEGLHEDTKYVATDNDGCVFQYRTKPHLPEDRLYWRQSDSFIGRAPESHRRPGPWSESLMEVMR